MIPKPETQMDKAEEKKAKAAEKKERKRLELEEKTKLLKKMHLRREIELGSRNAIRLRKSWREIMMKIKMPNIKEDCEAAWNTFDRVLDIKDYSISLLLDAVDNAEEQYQMNERAHIEQIDQFLKIYKTRIGAQESSYKSNLDQLLIEFEKEKEGINCENEKENFHLQTVMFSMDQNLEESLSYLKSTTLTKVKTQENDCRDFREMEGFMIKKIKDSWQELQGIVDNYETKTKKRLNNYATLKKKDESERNTIAHQVDQLSAAFEKIGKLKNKITNIKLTNERKTAEILEKRNVFQEAYWNVKNRFLKEQAIDKNLLKIMATEYNLTTRLLNKFVKKLENVLTMAQICRKYETQEEKVVPFVTTQLDKNKIITSSDYTRVEELQPLENFWSRAGTAEITVTELKQERDALKEESNYLRQCLKHYISEEEK